MTGYAPSYGRLVRAEAARILELLPREPHEAISQHRLLIYRGDYNEGLRTRATCPTCRRPFPIPEPLPEVHP